jgi:2-polyprenyl-3-methyl-5-hydroxy-6-metoxy-1,4-benzoquinol methylase
MSQDPSFRELHTLYQSLGDVRADFRNYNMYQLLVGMLKGKTHLDIGSGAGHFLYFSKNAGFDVAGIEPNQDLIDLSRELYGDLHVRSLFAQDLDTIAKRFDNITLIDVLEHIEDDAATIGKIKKLLEPGGQVIILVPQYPHLYGARDRRIGHFRRYTRRELTDKLLSQGFEIITTRTWNLIGYLPYLLSEKLLKREPSVLPRKTHPVSSGWYWVNKCLDLWFRHVENTISFGWGLSLIVIAKINEQGD